MNKIQPDKLVLFGAGKIGRSFIGQVFSRSGFEVVFIDILKPLIDELNKKKCYEVIFRSDSEESFMIKNIRGVYLEDENNVIDEMANARIVAVSVGVSGLDKIFPLIAKGLMYRYEKNANHYLDIIIAENLRNADHLFYNELARYLPSTFPLKTFVGLVETSIGKMVPVIQKKDINDDILKVIAEPYNTLIVSKSEFRNPIPEIIGINPKDNIKAWVDQKLFIHNMGHSAIAYIGFLYNPRFRYIYEVLSVPEIRNYIKLTMFQASEILISIYPGEFKEQLMKNYINNLISRFQNKTLGDTVFRVGSDIFRKLGADDRFAGIIKSAVNKNMPFDKILLALICGCYFESGNENGTMLHNDLEFVKKYKYNISTILSEVSLFNPELDHDVFKTAQLLKMQINLFKIGKISFQELVD